ncbi:hypothetical protein [Nitrospira lenta]|uniref:Uncharacterized protein n=1 Tax=Nitrospira lenta TaxID=1436998 RepID=A0A330LGS0_9BACT|nr:hypothetical protein [Nitrospira lenta]SPP66321.1 conserved exported hypothetical protein [Nitrospira lenta]
MRTRQLLALFGVTILIAGITGACAPVEQRDKRFYYRALWNFALREQLKELDIEFNGVDFGHSNLYENLLLTGAKDVSAIEDRARKETLRFIYSRPVLNPNEEAIAPNYMKLAWKAQNTFDEAHALHRATYDIYVSDIEDKKTAIHNVLAFYKESQYAITAKQLDHQRLDTFPYSKSFRRKFPLFNATIWAYHYLQVVVYDALAVAPDLPAKQKAVEPILRTYHGYLQKPPVEWTFMPMTAELSPKFAAEYPEIANIFDNLHMMHDNISDILTSDLLPTWEGKRQEIYRVTQTYYWTSADATNPFFVREGQPHHSGLTPGVEPGAPGEQSGHSGGHQ